MVLRTCLIVLTDLHIVDVKLSKLYELFLLLQSRELAITIVLKDQRQMCALKFLRLEDFLYDRRHGQAINLEPQGILFADVCVWVYYDHTYSPVSFTTFIPLIHPFILIRLQGSSRLTCITQQERPSEQRAI